MIRRLGLIVFGVLCLAALSFLWYRSVHAPVLREVSLASPEGEVVTLHVEMADDPDERAVGLMGRTALPNGQGMVFQFDEPQDLRFWMKNTLIPLDILFFDEAGMFVSRTTMSPCTTSDCRLYPSNGPAKTVLEVNAGEAMMAGVGRGWKINFSY